MNHKVISLFSGAGGLDLGLEKAGLEVALSQEIDKFAVQTLRANKKNVLEGNIKEIISLDPSCQTLLNHAGIKKDELFAIVGGPPCQSFSTAGKRKGLSDPRGTLFEEFSKAVDQLRPRFFVMENVKGLLSSFYENDGKMEPVFNFILAEFHRLGYKTVHKVLLAADYGVPQLRERLIVIGSRDNEDIYLPAPFFNKKNYLTVGEAFKNLKDDNKEFLNFPKDRVEFLKKIPEGGNWKNLSLDDQKKAMGNAFFSSGGRVGFFRRLSFSRPSPTLLTSPLQKATLLAHPIENRPLSINEYKRIQQFPDDYQFTGSIASKYRQIGNAVPVGLGEAIGKVLIETAKKTDEGKK